MPTLITESLATLTGSLEKTGAKRFRIKIIDEGVGSSGTYPAATLKLAEKEGVFDKGVHMYLDHPTALESMDRPERTVKDLAAVLDGKAVYESAALYAPIKAFSAYADTIEEMKDDIGVSIRATAEVEAGPNGERIITRLVEVMSVDFVTKAGRGGKVMEVLESAHARMVSEATASDIENWLERAVQAAHGTNGRGNYVYVRDHDAEFVYYRAHSESEDKRTLYREGYTLGDGDVTLAGDPIEVNAETVYKPVAPASPAPAAESKEFPSDPAGDTKKTMEENMAKIEVDEAVHTAAVEASGRVTALEAELKESKAREAKLIESNNKAAAAAVVTEAFKDVEAPETVKFLSESFTLNEDGSVNVDALKTRAETVAAEAKVNAGAGSVRGVGESAVTESKTVSDADIVAELHGGKK